MLAIAARKLGFGPVSGFDSDPESLSAARANAAANDVALRLGRLDLRTRPAPRGRAAAVITANLLRGLLLVLAGRLPAPPPTCSPAGCSREELDEASEAFRARLGLRERARATERRVGCRCWLHAASAVSCAAPAGGSRCRP